MGEQETEVRCPVCGQKHGEIHGGWFVSIVSQKREIETPMPAYVTCYRVQYGNMPCGTKIVVTSSGVSLITT